MHSNCQKENIKLVFGPKSPNLHASYTYKYKEKLVILQSIGIMVIKSKETRMIIYTCRYSSGHPADMTELYGLNAH